MPTSYLLPLLFFSFLKICLSAQALVHDQYVLNYGDDTMASIESDRLELSRSKTHYNLNFSNISIPHKSPRFPIAHLSPLKFTNFLAMNISASISQNLLAPQDADCALPSSPIALLTPNHTYATTSRFDLETSSGFFNLLGITLKPLGPAPPRVDASIRAWRIVDGKVEKVFSGGAVWGAGGYVKPIPANFPRFFPGWGERVNAVEIQAKAPDGRPWRVCVGRIELEVLEEE